MTSPNPATSKLLSKIFCKFRVIFRLLELPFCLFWASMKFCMIGCPSSYDISSYPVDDASSSCRLYCSFIFWSWASGLRSSEVRLLDLAYARMERYSLRYSSISLIILASVANPSFLRFSSTLTWFWRSLSTLGVMMDLLSATYLCAMYSAATFSEEFRSSLSWFSIVSLSIRSASRSSSIPDFIS